MRPLCPRCSRELTPRRMETGQPLACPARHGVLVTVKNLPWVLPADVRPRVEAALAAAKVHALRCPRCDAPTKIARVDDVEVDACTVCGDHWFDAGELDRLRAKSSPEPGRQDSPYGPGQTLLDLVFAWMSS